jgi:hypothetical protein
MIECFLLSMNPSQQRCKMDIGGATFITGRSDMTIGRREVAEVQVSCKPSKSAPQKSSGT